MPLPRGEKPGRDSFHAECGVLAYAVRRIHFSAGFISRRVACYDPTPVIRQELPAAFLAALIDRNTIPELLLIALPSSPTELIS